MRYALDTNIVVAALNDDVRVAPRLDELAPSEVVLPTPVLGELVYGALRSARRERNLQLLERVRRRFTVAPLDEAAAQCFGELKLTLSKRGEPKSDMDMLIAAIAISMNATPARVGHRPRRGAR